MATRPITTAARLAPALFALGALMTVEPTPATAQAQARVMKACAPEYARLCGTVMPGGGRIIACLKSNIGQVGDGCKKALGGAMKQGMARKKPG